MRVVDLIEKKKSNHILSKEDIHFLIQGYVKNEIPDYQISALLMAICINGMNDEEIANLTEEMLYSGDIIDLSNISGIKCDKHSTGGVGDKTSLALMPMVAACGVKVAKLSGRGLGHTGGTLDKLESIQGMNVCLSEDEFVKQVNDIGIAMMGQTKQLVPADKKLYALRDVTGTVNSIPLIASSIMSKKIAAGSDTILLDVKFGEGAFMETPQKAQELAKTMITIGKHFKKDVKAIISNMNEPLGNAIGNALEVKEAIQTLQGKGPKDFTELCIEAGSIMLMQAKISTSLEDARKRLQEVIRNGKALQKFIAMVSAQGGNVEQILNPENLPKAKYIIPMKAKCDGYVQNLHALQLGILAMKLGAGRMVKEDCIDPSVGIVLNKKLGEYIKQGDVLAYIHTNHELTKDWIDDFYKSYDFSNTLCIKTSLIHDVILD